MKSMHFISSSWFMTVLAHFYKTFCLALALPCAIKLIQNDGGWINYFIILVLMIVTMFAVKLVVAKSVRAQY